MKINCICNNKIIDQTDNLKNKGHLIADSQWFEFWDSVDDAIEHTGNSSKEKEEACMQLRKQFLFKTLWECQNCGRLYIDGQNGDLISYSPINAKYNGALDKKRQK